MKLSTGGDYISPKTRDLVGPSASCELFSRRFFRLSTSSSSSSLLNNSAAPARILSFVIHCRPSAPRSLSQPAAPALQDFVIMCLRYHQPCGRRSVHKERLYFMAFLSVDIVLQHDHDHHHHHVGLLDACVACAYAWHNRTMTTMMKPIP